jgi:class 3 adenylate cyclase
VNEIPRDDAERKQVTVLFADVSGSMDLAEQEDPEEWRKIMQRFFSMLADSVTRFEGTVDKFTGDGIMAIFGAPVAYEDHAQRACYAALRMLDDVAEYAAELRRAKELNFSTRIGINSGEVVAGAIADGDDGDYTAIGHTVGLAQRMEALAEPGKAYLTERTAALARGFLDLRDLGEFTIKGSSRPIEVFELVGTGSARSRIDLSRQRGFSRFVGRGDEMETLDEALRQAEQAQGHMIGIVGEPGVGKSRLCLEFTDRCRDSGLEVFEAQGQSHGKAIPYMPVLQMMRAYFGIGDRDKERIAREKIAGRALLLDPDFAEDLPIIFDFLGVPDPDRPQPQMSAEARQRALARIVCRLVTAPRRRGVVVLVIEDLHWLDEGSDAMLASLVSSLEGTQTLVVVNFRPEYEHGWNGSAIYREIPLEPLRRSDTRELLRDIAGDDPSLDGLDEEIHERTAGNPFFIEEIVRELAEAGFLEGERGAYRLARPVEDAGVPVSVQTVLAARIDRLEPESKQLLQVASVVGREVSEKALALAAGVESGQLAPRLRELVSGGFLYEAELYPERVFAFRHPLTREVAYSSQLAGRRAATHSAVARALIELEPERLDELAALIASHFEAGGEPLEAARWSARAAHWSGHSRPKDALRLWQQTTELVSQVDEQTEETRSLAVFSRLLQLDYAWRLGMDPERAASLADEATQIATEVGDLRSLAMLRLLTAARPGLSRSAEEWIAASEDAIRLADQSEDPALRVGVRVAGSYAYMCAGQFDRLVETLDRALELTDGDPSVGVGIVLNCPVAWAYFGKAVAQKERGQPDQAIALLDEAVRLADQYGDPETEGWSRGLKATVLADAGEGAAALTLARRNCELTERLGDVFSRCVALADLAYVEVGCGEPGSALDSVERAESMYWEAMLSGGEMEAWRGTVRARALLGLGRADEAVEAAERATETARTRGMLWQLPTGLQALAQARSAAGLGGVEEALDEAVEICGRYGHRHTLGAIEAEREALTAGAR